MIQRFKIEDLVIQDTSGVVFRALDTETSLPVAVRRFFPFGPTGGGLNEAEQAEYAHAVSRFSEIRHPALSTVIYGGSDPVDGMPYIATEWIEGKSLKTLLESRPLSQPETVALISLAMEACGVLSEVVGYDGVWVDTDPASIIRGEEAHRPFIFWVSPLKMLGGGDSSRGLEPLVELTMTAMGWNAGIVGSPASGGLGTWLKWLHGADRTTTLHEAREKLAAAIGSEPPAPASRQVRTARQVTRPVVAAKKKPKAKKKVPAWLVACIILSAIGFGGWKLIQRNATLLAQASEPLKPAIEIVESRAIPDSAPAPAPVAEETPVADEPRISPTPVAVIPGESPEDRANRRAAEYMETAQKTNQAQEAKADDVRQQIAAKGGIFNPSDSELLVTQNRTEVTVEGTFKEIAYSSTKKTMYITFSEGSRSSDFRGAISSRDANGDLSESELGSLAGKKIRLQGKIRIEGSGSRSRPVIDITSRSAIQSAE